MQNQVTYMNVENFLRAYMDFLIGNGLSESSARVYAGKLRKLLRGGYSVGDLCGLVERLIKSYGKGGDKFDPKDHGNTYNALKWLWRFLNGDLVGDLYIHYRKGWSSFVPVGKYMVEYTISGNIIEVKYDVGFGSGSVERKVIKVSELCVLIDIMKRHSHLLSKSHSTVNTVHDVMFQYDYRFDGREETRCGSLFDDDKAMGEYNAWLNLFVN